MALPFHTLKSGKRVKLGRKIPDTPPKVVQLQSFFDRNRALRGIPDQLDYWTQAAKSLERIYLNDQYGDCVIAGKLHQLGVYSANNYGAAKVILATDAEALQQYHAICGPGDNGCFIGAVLDYWMKKGLKAGGKLYPLDGYAGVDASNLVLLKTAIHIFGSVTFGIDLPAAWLNTDDGEEWDVTSSRSVGGHDVPAVGYSKRGVVISTWGGLRTITWAALESGRYIDECYVQLSPAWYDDDRLAPSGFDVEGLRAALDKFKAGELPADPDPVPPGPGPGPGPGPIPPAPVPPPAPSYWFPTYTVKGQIREGGPDLPAPGFVVDLLLSPAPGQGINPAGDRPARFNWDKFIELIVALANIIIPLVKGGQSREQIEATLRRMFPNPASLDPFLND